MMLPAAAKLTMCFFGDFEAMAITDSIYSIYTILYATSVYCILLLQVLAAQQYSPSTLKHYEWVRGTRQETHLHLTDSHHYGTRPSSADTLDPSPCKLMLASYKFIYNPC